MVSSSSLPKISVIAIFLEFVIILLAPTLYLKLGLAIIGCLAGIMEMFYENAGVNQGSWTFNENGVKIGKMSLEFVPIASLGSVVVAAFIDWLVDARNFPFGGQYLFQAIQPWLVIIGIGLFLGTLLFFTWRIFYRHLKLETLWLVIPLFLTGLFSIENMVLQPVIFGMLLTIYLSAILETVLLAKTDAYEYHYGYRPAATSIAYSFFTSALYLLVLGPQGMQIMWLWSISPLIPISVLTSLLLMIITVVISVRAKPTPPANQKGIAHNSHGNHE